MRRALATVLAVAALSLLAACGDDGDSEASGKNVQLTVSAATSLKTALTDYAKELSGRTVRLSFAGSDELAAQIRQGVKPDVFAAANTALPEALAQEGLVETPVTFTGNRLVMAVPAEGDDEVRALADLARPGVKIAVGAPSVPVGAYTRKVLERLPAAQRKAILANVRSNEPDVGGVVGKLTQGAVDAGFVYITDVKAAGADLRAIDLPPELEPVVAYGAAVVKGAKEPEAAKAFVDGLVAGKGQEALRAAGFQPPPPK